MLPDWIERGAHWILLCTVLLAGFLLAWCIQASRRRQVVFQLWEAHQRRQQEQLEECRLLAEDQAIEQASRLAYQARRIEQLKAALARPSALVADNMASMPGVGNLPTVTHKRDAMAGARPHPDPAPRQPAVFTPPAPQPADSAQQSTGRQVSEAVQTMLKERLARELHLNRERARLIRRYEAESIYWQQACLHSQAACDNLQAAVTALENALNDTRATWAAAEREVEHLRKQLEQQRARSLPGYPETGMAGTHFTLRSTHDDTPKDGLSALNRVRYHYAALSHVHRADAPDSSSRLDHHAS